MAQELFANDAATTVLSGGTNAPARGTGESWTVTSSASFPAASSTASPPTQFHVADPAAPSEVIAVTNVSGTSWTVTRGAESTTPVTHSAGFTIVQIVTAGVYSAMFPLIPTSVQSGTVTASPGQMVLMSTAGTAGTINFPHAPPGVAAIGAKLVTYGSANTVTIKAAGGDVFSGGGSTATLQVLGEGGIWQYDPALTEWVKQSNDLPLPQLDIRYVSLVNASPSTATGAAFNGVTSDAVALNAAQGTAQTLTMPNGTAAIGASVYFQASKERIQGAGMRSTILQATTGIDGILRQLVSGFVSQVEISDMTLDGNNLATGAMEAVGAGVGRLTLRRVRFINFPSVIIDAGRAAEFVIEDCYADGAGLSLGSFFTATNKPFESLILRRNRLRWLQNGIEVGANGYHAAYVEIADNDIDLGWWLTKALVSGPAGTVTYTSTGLADTDASFSGLPSPQTVRAMPVRQTGTFTSNTNGTYLEDTSATFQSDGLLRGEIVRSGTSFAVISMVLSQTALHVEEWLGQASYQPVQPPASGSSYTAYGIILANITGFTSTTLTVDFCAAGGGGGWHDLTGTSITPATGTLYEITVPNANYPVVCTNVTDKLQVTGNRVRRGWSDNLEIFGNRMIVTGNIVEDGQDEGIAIQGLSPASPALGSVVSGNICHHNGTSGLTVINATGIEVGPNQYHDNGWNQPSGNGVAQVNINNSAGVTVTGGHATNTGASTPQYGLQLEGSATTSCKLQGFTGMGNALADIYVYSSVPAGANEILNCSGSLAYAGTSNGQRIVTPGTGVPAFPASPGSQFLRTDGGASTTLYVKESATDNTGWNAMADAVPVYGKRVAYSAITSPIAAAAASTLTTSMTAFTGSLPSITLPSDGHTYRVSLHAPSVAPSTQQQIAVGIGTAGTAILKFTELGFGGEIVGPCYVQVDVAGSGQTISCFAYASSNGNVTLAADANAPAELSAVLVA